MDGNGLKEIPMTHGPDAEVASETTPPLFGAGARRDGLERMDGWHERLSAELRTANLRAEELATELTRLLRVEQEGLKRERLLKTALRALLQDFEYRLTTLDVPPRLTKDVPTVLREASEALERR
jgi:hypothetical protein